MQTMKKSLGFVAVILAFALLAGCGALNGVGGAATATPVVPLVQSGGGVVAQGNIVPRDFTRVYTRSGGQVAEVLVNQGDKVSKDAVIVRFGDHEGRQAALTTAQLEQTSAQQALDDLKKQSGLGAADAQSVLTDAQKALVNAQQALDTLDVKQYQDDLDTLQKDVGTAKSDLDDAQKEFDKYKSMDASNSTRKTAEDKLKDSQKKYNDAIRKRDLKVNELDAAKANVAAAQAKRDEAQRQVDKRSGGADPDQLALAQARLSNAQEQIKSAQQALEDMQVKAPFDGTITDLGLTVGETVLPNQPVFQIADLTELYVETNDLTEMDVVKIKANQKATVVPDALGDLKLPAHVDRIEQVSGKKGGDVTYTVRLKLDQTDPRLRWGMTMEVRFAE